MARVRRQSPTIHEVGADMRKNALQIQDRPGKQCQLRRTVFLFQKVVEKVKVWVVNQATLTPAKAERCPEARRIISITITFQRC